MLVAYSEDEEGEDELPESTISGGFTPVALQAAEDTSSTDEEDEEEGEQEAQMARADDDPFVGPARPPEAGPCSRVVPVALMDAADNDGEEDEEDDEPQDDPLPATVLPAPDFTGWHPAGGGAPVRAMAPLVTALGKQKRRAAGPSHISSGPRPSVTRHDALRAAAQAELDHEIEERGRNHGFSSAYDSVFRGARAEDGEGERRTKVTRKGGVRTMSKKEIAEEDAMLASLR
eukprot:scaffold13823_cov129-Isochrysis_galbana.AAC.2